MCTVCVVSVCSDYNSKLVMYALIYGDLYLCAYSINQQESVLKLVNK